MNLILCESTGCELTKFKWFDLSDLASIYKK